MENTQAITKRMPTIMQMSLEGASRSDMVRFFGRLTMAQIIKNKYPSIVKSQEYYGLKKVKEALRIMFVDLSASFSGELHAKQIEEICTEVSAASLRSLSLEDVYLCCRTIKYSKHYGALNVNKILVSLEDYFDKKSEAVASKNYNDHLASKFTDRNRTSLDQRERDKFHEAGLRYKAKQIDDLKKLSAKEIDQNKNRDTQDAKAWYERQDKKVKTKRF